MRAIGEYIISVCTAALLCGILNSMMLKGPAKEILKLVSGLFLAFCVISPVSNIRLPDLMAVSEELQLDAQSAADAGEEITDAALCESIIGQLSEYILDKAKSMGLYPEVEVILQTDGSYLPKAVYLSGEAPIVKRTKLIQEIAEDLGLAKEDVQWTGGS